MMNYELSTEWTIVPGELNLFSLTIVLILHFTINSIEIETKPNGGPI